MHPNISSLASEDGRMHQVLGICVEISGDGLAVRGKRVNFAVGKFVTAGGTLQPANVASIS